MIKILSSYKDYVNFKETGIYGNVLVATEDANYPEFSKMISWKQHGLSENLHNQRLWRAGY